MATRKRKASPAQLRARKLFAKRAKAGVWRKKKTTRKNPKRKVKVKVKVKAKRIKRSPLRAMGSAKKFAKAKGAKVSMTTRQRATSGAIKNPKKTGRRASTSKFIIMGVKPSRSGYKYYYLKPNGKYDDDVRKAQKWNNRAACHLKMRSAFTKLPFALSSIRCVKL